MRHLVWDWNGTLLDDLPLIVDSANAALAAFEAEPISITEYRERFARPVIVFYRWALGRELEPGEAEIIDEAFFDHYHAGLDGIGLHADALPAVDAARRRGATQSVLSMWWHDRLVPAVDRLGLAPHMALIDGLRGEAGASKQEHLARHLGKLRRLLPGLRAGDVVVIGDVADDADAAGANGTGCVLVDTGSQSRPALEGTGRPVVGSLCEAVELALEE